MRSSKKVIFIVALLLAIAPFAWWLSPFYGDSETWEAFWYWHRIPHHGLVRPLYPIRIGGQQGFMDIHGDVAIEPRFSKVYPFAEGLAAAQEGALWGFIDEAGARVILPQFATVSYFREGRARISFRLSGPMGYTDKAGKVTVAPQFDSAGDYVDGVARVGFETPWSKIRSSFADVGRICTYRYIDKSGEYVSPPSMDNLPIIKEAPTPPIQRGDTIRLPDGDATVGWVYEPRDGLVKFTVDKGARVGYVDLKGNVVWSPSR